jgi:hypothetical protein
MGYLKYKCDRCGEPIYLKEDWDGVIRPYESWLGGKVPWGTWARHECRPSQPAARTEAPRTHLPDKVETRNGNRMRTIAGCCDRLIGSGMPIETALDILARLGSIQASLSAHGLNPLKEVVGMLSAFDEQRQASPTRLPGPSTAPNSDDDEIPF